MHLGHRKYNLVLKRIEYDVSFVWSLLFGSISMLASLSRDVIIARAMEQYLVVKVINVASSVNHVTANK